MTDTSTPRVDPPADVAAHARTHYEGCEQLHHACALAKLAEARAAYEYEHDRFKQRGAEIDRLRAALQRLVDECGSYGPSHARTVLQRGMIEPSEDAVLEGRRVLATAAPTPPGETRRVETRYNIGQTVWPIMSWTRHDTVPCETCEGRGRFEVLPGKFAPCPDASYSGVGHRCDNGRKHRQWRTEWVVEPPSQVGSIQFEIRAAAHRRYETARDHSTVGLDEERYMLERTGVGAGTVWGVNKLFASEAEAQAECDLRNATAPRWTLDKNGKQTMLPAPVVTPEGRP
jgi:hypothetical protein